MKELALPHPNLTLECQETKFSVEAGESAALSHGSSRTPNGLPGKNLSTLSSAGDEGKDPQGWLEYSL